MLFLYFAEGHTEGEIGQECDLSVKQKKWLLLSCALFLVVAVVLLPQFITKMGFPSQLKIIQGIDQSLQIHFPFDVYISCDNPEQLLINGQLLNEERLKINLSDPIQLQSNTVGTVRVDFKLFGLLPIRHMEVDVRPEVYVYPSGHSIGVLLHSDGVMVVEDSYVDGKDGKRYYPAREGGIGPGDYLLEMNSKKLYSKQDVATQIYEAGRQGKPLMTKVRDKNGKVETKMLQPVQNKDGVYMIGLYIEDGVAGVGTMTFYEPKSGYYGALGHVITDAYTRKPIKIRAGEIVKAHISGINSGRRGVPGEKLGTFTDYQDVLGVIDKNCEYGIYGKLNTMPENSFFKEPIPVATSRQIECEKAWIYTVVEGGNIEKFAIKIERVFYQSKSASKGLIIEIIDPTLLRITGGIIQGMSGSPIVQNGRFVGAVTHVFVNDPKKGYGVLAEWMIKEAGLNSLKGQQELAR